MAHWGGGMLFYELMPEINEEFKNIYYDTAASPLLYKDDVYDIAIKIVGSERIIFGSDFPLIKFKRHIDSITKSVKNREDRKNILGRNAEKILRLKK
ncbi:MAG: amidohydrolase family protein [Spirochaetes bacterium]|nr:amidohydrolase family protein [Spirochaetota bacterium]